MANPPSSPGTRAPVVPSEPESRAVIERAGGTGLAAEGPVPRWVLRTAGYAWAAVGLALAAAGLGYALFWLASTVVPVALAFLLAALLGGPTGWLRRRGVPRVLAVVAVLVLTALLLVGALLFVGERAAAELGSLDVSLKQGVGQVQSQLDSLGVVSSEQLSEAAGAAYDQFVAGPKPKGGERTSVVLSGALTGFSVLAEAALALFVLFFFLLEGERMWRFFVGLAPARQEDFDTVGQRAWGALNAYLRGIALVALFNAVTLALALYLIGVPLVRSLAILMFLATFVPVVGSYLAGTAAALVALAFNGGSDALLVVAAVVVIGQVEGNLFYPRVVGRRVRLHPAVIVLVLSVGTTLAGVVGALVAVPIAAMVGAGASYLRSRRAAPTPMLG